MAKITGILKNDTRFNTDGEPVPAGRLVLHGETVTVDAQYADILVPSQPEPRAEPEFDGEFEDKQAGPTASSTPAKRSYKRGKKGGQ